MNIVLKTNPVKTTQQPNVDFEMGDNGNAFVSMSLIISDTSQVKYRLVHDEQYSGSLSRSLPLSKGTYFCTLVIQAFRQSAVGPVYDSFLNISGISAATAKGSIPTGQPDDLGYTKFTLIV